MDGCLLLDPRRTEVEDGGLEYPGDDAYRRHISPTGGRHFLPPPTHHPSLGPTLALAALLHERHVCAHLVFKCILQR